MTALFTVFSLKSQRYIQTTINPKILLGQNTTIIKSKNWTFYTVFVVFFDLQIRILVAWKLQFYYAWFYEENLEQVVLYDIKRQCELQKKTLNDELNTSIRELITVQELRIEEDSEMLSQDKFHFNVF